MLHTDVWLRYFSGIYMINPELIWSYGGFNLVIDPVIDRVQIVL